MTQKQRKITDFITEHEPKKAIELRELLEGTVERIEAEYSGSIELLSPGSVHVWTGQSIGNAVEELLTNSIVHAEIEDRRPRVWVHPGNETIRIHVEDENPPIPEMDRDVLSGRDELGALRHGSGLGLWLLKLIVDHAGGSVTYERTEAGGNRVTIELPASSRPDGPDID